MGYAWQTIALTALVAFIVGMLFAAKLSDMADKEAVQSGYLIVKGQAYRVSPVESR